jgi:hypothetical protein
VVKPKQEGENPLIDSLKAKKRVKDYLDGLGLAIDLRAAGEHKFLNADAQNLYDSVTNLVADSKLPTELPSLRLEYSKPDCLKREAEIWISTYGFIWGNDNRRSTQNHLNISQPDDRGA